MTLGFRKMQLRPTKLCPRTAIIIISSSLVILGILYLYEVRMTRFKLERPIQMHCIPHGMLLALYGRPGPCNETHLILHCPDPYLEYIHDPQVLNFCGITQTNSEAYPTQGRAEMFHMPACHQTERSLLSKRHLSMKPSTTSSSSKDMVPNIVHYINLGCERTFSFANYLSVLSVHKFVHPDVIYFHGDCTPIGLWWERTLQDVPNIYFRKRRRLETIQGCPPMWIEHETDVLRLQVLQFEGGIYLDTDLLVLAPIDALRHYPVTLGRQRSWKREIILGNSFIMAQPNSPFICMWLHAYREYNPTGHHDAWSKYSNYAPGILSMYFPEHIHVENDSFYTPGWHELHKIYDEFYNWTNNYSIHLWNKLAKRRVIPDDPSAIPSKYKVNSTLHEIFRYIYFDEKIINANTSGTSSGSQGLWISLSFCIQGTASLWFANRLY